MIKNSIKLKPEECIPSSDFEVDWNDSLGQGSFGSVFRGKYKSHDIAVKVLNVFDRTQFLDEISVLRKVIGNKHIINYYGWSIVRPPMVFNEFCCIISNYCPLNLRSVIQNKDNYKEEIIFYRFMKYLKQIANALNHLARNGVIHRGIKISPILS
jgi:serine/threonine protein kinase